MSPLYAALCDLPDAREEFLAEDRERRRRLARMNHWCRDCLGHTGPGSPCAIEEDEPSTDNDEENDQ